MARKRKERNYNKWKHVSIKDAPSSPPIDDEVNYVTVAEAATIIGVTTAAIRMRLQDISYYKKDKKPLKIHLETAKEVFNWIPDE